MRNIRPSAKPAPLVTQPSPTLLTRTVRRHVAACVVPGETGCDFNNRDKPQLHANAGAAQVESVRHLRAAHAQFLSIEVTAKRQRQVVNETLELIVE
jgi:hypothetical protein